MLKGNGIFYCIYSVNVSIFGLVFTFLMFQAPDSGRGGAAAAAGPGHEQGGGRGGGQQEEERRHEAADGHRQEQGGR